MSSLELFLTGRLIVVAWVACFAVGVPIVTLSAPFLKMRPDARDLWFYSPLVGAAAIILICQNLLYLDVTSSRSAILIWLLAAAGWVAVLSSSAKREMLLPLPWLALVLAAAVYLIHGIGLLELGASYYYGYGWHDMINYVSLAQFFADFPFHASAVGHGYIEAAQHFKLDRIGQSVLHAFLMVSSGADAQQSFGTTILLSPFLLFFALLAIARRFVMKPGVCYLAALAGALSPTVATVHLECFFSQAMCLPFLVLWPVAIARLVDAPGWRTALPSGLLLAVICAIYTEMMPIALGIAIVCCVAKDAAGSKLLQRIFAGPFYQHRSTRLAFGTTLVWLPVAVAIGAFANLGFLRTAVGIFFRTTDGAVLTGIYPWAFKFEGGARLWFGNQVDLDSKWMIAVAATAIAAITAANMIFLTICARRRFSFLLMALAMLMLAPLGPLVAGHGSKHGYQFYKLVLMTAPLHAAWFVIGCHLLWPRPLAARSYATAVGALLVAVNGFFLAGIAHASAKVETIPSSHRGGAHLLINADFRQIRDFLAATHDRDVLTLWFDDELEQGAYRSFWIGYFARNNRVLSGQAAENAKLSGDAIAEIFFPPQRMPSDARSLVLVWKPLDSMAQQLLFSNARFFVYEARFADDIRRLVDASRVTLSRTLKLDATLPFDADNWFPLWIAGGPDNASMLTMKFAEPNQFRYDQWGYPPAHFQPGGDCKGRAMTLAVEFMPSARRLRLICNGVVAEADVPSAFSALSDRRPQRLGWNAGIGSLEGKYPLAETFPGSIDQVPPVVR